MVPVSGSQIDQGFLQWNPSPAPRLMRGRKPMSRARGAAHRALHGWHQRRLLQALRWLVLSATASLIGAPAAFAKSGLELFLENGCGACHSIRGTEARGAIAPDLTHVGSRLTIGAGTLPNTEEAIARFITRPDLVKPGVKMPAFHMLPETDIRAIAAYLKALR
jgi:mono/diheme cytochrome c family protein